MSRIENWKKIGKESWYNRKFSKNKGRYLRVTSSGTTPIKSLRQGPFYVEVKDRGEESYKKLIGPLFTADIANEEAILYMRKYPLN